MAFRKRNIALGRPKQEKDALAFPTISGNAGTRPSSLTTQLVTSTGTSSVDELLGGHGGLAFGSSILIEESGTTDFAGAIIRYYAAEGICHGHVLHIVGVGEGWIRELPGIAEGRSSQKESNATDEDRMKIAWRYEQLGQAGGRALPDRNLPVQAEVQHEQKPFCHTFDLSKRLTIPQDAKINHIQLARSSSPFNSVLYTLQQNLQTSPPNSIHRLVIPTILSPALYPPNAGRPENFTCFLHSLRSLLRQHANRLTIMITFPLELYPRSTGLVRWAEILSDGVIELTPFPHLMDASNSLAESGGARGSEEKPQGLVKVHKVPIDTERGEGGAGVGNSIGEDLAFTVSRRKFVIKPFSLPPLEGDREAQKDGGKLTGKDVEF